MPRRVTLTKEEVADARTGCDDSPECEAGTKSPCDCLREQVLRRFAIEDHQDEIDAHVVTDAEKATMRRFRLDPDDERHLRMWREERVLGKYGRGYG